MSDCPWFVDTDPDGVDGEIVYCTLPHGHSEPHFNPHHLSWLAPYEFDAGLAGSPDETVFLEIEEP